MLWNDSTSARQFTRKGRTLNPADIRMELERFRQAGVSGDDMAAAQLESRFGEGLTRYVRRVLRNQQGSGSLAEFILNEARNIRDERLNVERDELVSELLSRICLIVTGQGIAGRVDTVPLGDRPTLSVT